MEMKKFYTVFKCTIITIFSLFLKNEIQIRFIRNNLIDFLSGAIYRIICSMYT